MNLDSSPVKVEGNLPLVVLGASGLYDECPFECLGYFGVKKIFLI